MATFADPPGGPDHGRRTSDAPHGCPAGESASGAWGFGDPGPGSTRSVARHARACRARRWLGDHRHAGLRSRRRRRALVRLRHRRPPRPARRRPAPTPPRPGRRAPRSQRPVRRRPASGASVRFALAWDLPVVEFGGGRRWWKRYTRDWGRSGDRAWDLAVHALARDACVARGDRGAGSAPILDDVSGRPGTAPRCSTSCTSSSTVARSGRRARSAVPSPLAMTPGGSPSSNASTTRSTTPSTSISTLHSRCSSCSRSWRSAGSATFWRPSRCDDRTTVSIQASGREAPRKTRRHGPARCRWPGRRSVLPAQLVSVPGCQRLEGSRPEVRPAGMARRRRGGSRPAMPSSARCTRRSTRSSVVLSPAPTATVTACRSTRANRIRRMTRGRCGDRPPTVGSLWLAAVAAAEAMARRLGDGEAERRWAGWFERGQVAFDRRLWRGRYFAYDDGAGPSSGLRSWPTSCAASGTRM